MKAICRIYKVGGSNSITVNQYVIEKLKLDTGDFVEVEFVKKVKQ